MVQDDAAGRFRSGRPRLLSYFSDNDRDGPGTVCRRTAYRTCMKARRRIGLICFGLAVVWFVLCTVAGVIAAEGALHPLRRSFSFQMEAVAQALAERDHSILKEVSVSGDDGALLKAWEIRPEPWNGDAVLLLHGQSDNRAGMLGPADLLLRHRFSVLLPDARAHGSSGGTIATYGIEESSDIRDWFRWIERTEAPHCVDALGDSMGAAQLLESLNREPGFCAVVAESPFANFREASFDRIGQQLGLGEWAGRILLRPAIETGLVYTRWKYGVDLSGDEPDRAVANSRVPVLLIHGLKDNNLPARHSEMILARNHGRNPNVSLWEPVLAGHCGAANAEPLEFEQRVIGWFEDHRLHPPPQARQ